MKITANQLRRIIKEEVSKATRRRVSESFGDPHSQTTAEAIQDVFDNTMLSNKDDYIVDVQEAAVEQLGKDANHDLDALFERDPSEWLTQVENVIFKLLSSDLQYRAESLADFVGKRMRMRMRMKMKMKINNV
jgi:malonyl CoA-acyl carrier protein transacylase